MAHRIVFTPSCRHDINQASIHTLFGIGYFPGRNMVSFGWRYDMAPGMVEVMAMWRDSGVPYSLPIGLVSISTPHVYVIRRHMELHQMFLDKRKIEVMVPAYEWGVRLHCRLAVKAPHDMDIQFQAI